MSKIILSEAMAELPLIAILRGVQPNEVVAVGEVLVEEGFRVIEVPLNSPDPYTSIAALAKRFDGDALIGAGTVLNTDQVDQVRDAGGELIISPNTNAEVIRYSKELGLVSVPGFLTPSEAFCAIEAGADALKLFPADALSKGALKAYSAVLPAIPVYAVSGVGPNQFEEYLNGGASGFGLGSGLYKAGMSIDQVRMNARSYVDAYKAIGA